MTARPFVLRSVHFPPEMDESLRQLAFELNRPKAEVIRLFIRLGLDILNREAGSDRHKTEQFFRKYETRSIRAGKTANESSRDDDIAHVRKTGGQVRRSKELEPKELVPSMPALYSGFYPDLKYRPTSRDDSHFIPVVPFPSAPIDMAISAAGIALQMGNLQEALDLIRFSIKHGSSQIYRRRGRDLLLLLAVEERRAGHYEKAQELEREADTVPNA
ncbi:hypothetical protein LJR267_010839 [Paraburkholderia hospita]|uniref:hypothetical protein n=1 Tax=Paraburkholderia hospita TaxID=169430 RepID=UPI003ECCE2F5